MLIRRRVVTVYRIQDSFRVVVHPAVTGTLSQDESKIPVVLQHAV